jgi:hypothetical protein
MNFHENEVTFEKTSNPWYEPESYKRLLEGLLEKLDLSRPNVDLIIVDHNINDPEVAILSAKLLESMMKKRMEKGDSS